MTNPLFYLSDLGADRLKALRDGVEDYVYYTLLEKLASEKKDVDVKIILENVKTLVFIPIVCGGKDECPNICFPNQNASPTCVADR